MVSPVRIYGLSGSLRKDSFSTAILRTLKESLASEAELTMGDIGTLPLYNQDIDGDNSPPSVVAMRKAVGENQALLIVSSEYNYGIPGVLKNAIDWLSRPAYKSTLIGKPFHIITSSPAFTGGVRAQAQIREALMAALARPTIGGEVVIGSVQTKIANGRLTDQPSLDFALKAVRQLMTEAQGAGTTKAT